MAVPSSSEKKEKSAEAGESKEVVEERVKEKKKRKKEEKKEKDKKRKRSRSSRRGREESIEATKSPRGKELKRGKEEFPWHQTGGSVGVKEERLRVRKRLSIQRGAGTGPLRLRCHRTRRKEAGERGAHRARGASRG